MSTYRNPPRWLLAVYVAFVVAAYLALSTADYNDARQQECANRSNKTWDVSWDSSTDTCKKELRNGTTSQNR